MTGPCLCGDQYCPSCGDPSRMAVDAAIEEVADTAYEIIETPDEGRIFVLAGAMAVYAHREAVDNAVKEALANQADYIEWLKDRVYRLENPDD